MADRVVNTGRNSNRKIDVVGHRGAAAYAPENTMASFQLAYDLSADWFELDCTLSKDGRVIVIHDDTVDRTTNGHGRVNDLTLVDLKKLDAGSWKDAKFKREKLPTLSEVLDFAKGRLGVFIEIKDSDNDKELFQSMLERANGRQRGGAKLLAEFMDAIMASGTRNLELTRKVIAMACEGNDRILIQSFSPVICTIVAAEAPELRVDVLGVDSPKHPIPWDTLVWFGRLIGIDGINPNKESVTRDRVASLHRMGKKVSVWTVDEPRDVKRLAAFGVNAIITNKPDMALRTLNRKPKKL